MTCDLVARLFDVEPVAGALHRQLSRRSGSCARNAQIDDGRLVAGGVTS